MNATIYEPERKYTQFVLLTILAIIIAAILGGIMVLAGAASDWNEIRCDPMVMPMASLYGHDTAENFNYCMNSSFSAQANARMGPVYGMMAGMVGTLGTLVESTQKLRYSTANLYGGVTNIMRDFSERLKLFFIQIKIGGQRMKMLMRRVYATFFSLIFMSMSGLTAINNFTGTTLFGVLDTFCFDPDTLVLLEGRAGPIPIRHARIGDRFQETGGVITAFFEFLADGQPMVVFPGSKGKQQIVVSTNHYMAHEGSWIKAGDHPDAIHIGGWTGGTGRPIICLNTTDHQIPVGQHIFRDYDETEAAHYDAMLYVHRTLNGTDKPFITGFKDTWDELYPSVAPDVNIRMRDGTYKAAAAIQLGDKLAQGDMVHGIIRMLVHDIVYLNEFADKPIKVGAGTLVWNPEEAQWVRAGDLHCVHVTRAPLIFYGFITLPGSKLELESGYFVRDYFEVASPDTEKSYTAALESMSAPVNARSTAILV